MRSSGLISFALAFSLKRASAQDCPNGMIEVDVQTITSIIQHPFLITGYVRANTVVTVGGGLPFEIMNAPVDISTQITSTEYSTRTATAIQQISGSGGAGFRGPNNPVPPVPGTVTAGASSSSAGRLDGPAGIPNSPQQSTAVLPGYVTTTVGGGSGQSRTTITIYPSGTRSGTIVVITPAPRTNGPVIGGGGGLTTITEPGASAGRITIPGVGSTAQGTVVVVTQAPNPFNGPFVTITVAGPPGSSPTQYTLDPINGGATGTVIVQTPGVSAFNGPYTTITYGYDGPVTQTITLQPGASGSEGTVIVQVPITSNGVNNGPNQVTSTGTSTTSRTSTSSPTASVDPNNPDPNNPPGPCTPNPGANGAPFCQVSLPPACQRLNGIIVAVSVLDLAGCTLALGGRAVGDVAQCLTSTLLAGPSIVSCLTTYLVGTPCITNLPAPCLELVVDVNAGSTLNNDVRLCGNALGPYAGGTAAQACLDTSVNYDGIGIVACLQTAFGFPVVSPTLPQGCPGAPVPQPRCPITASALPNACTTLVNFNGLTLLVEVPVCLLALGAAGAVGSIANCLNTGSITILTQGSSIVSCLTSALSVIGQGACLTTLPAVCAKIAGLVDTAALAAQVALCTTALRVYDVNNAISACLGNASSGGPSMVDCLNFRLFGIGQDPLVSLG